MTGQGAGPGPTATDGTGEAAPAGAAFAPAMAAGMGVPPASAEGPMVTFGIGEALLALPVARVREILDARPVAALPKAPPHLLGVIDVRGASVPVVDLRRLLSEAPLGDTEDTRILVLSLDRAGAPAALALRTDRVFEVAELDPGGIDPLSEAGALDWRRRIVAGVGRRAGRFVTVLSLERMFGPGLPGGAGGAA